MANIPISPDRLWRDIMVMAEIGATERGGCNRQTLTDLDGEARRLLASWAEEVGLAVEVDRLGNMRCLRPGRDPTRGVVAIGSHLDTQPSGGKFDGPLGVLTGLEIMRALHETGIQTEAPLMLINWTNEEGSRFTPSMLGSGTAMGFIDEQEALAQVDASGASVGDELRRIGWQGSADPRSLQTLEAYFEVHIEQGTILEDEGADVGIVTHAAAQTWFEVTVTGAEAHGGSAMLGRRDALVTSAHLICAVERIALAEQARGTVGRLTLSPDSRNVVPGRVWFTMEFRAGDADVLGRMEAAFRQEAASLMASRALEVAVKLFWVGPVTPFDPVLVERLRSAARRRKLRHRDMPTVIGHDAVYAARKVPSALLFVPCVGGVSHNEDEAITREWAASGLAVLADAVLETAGLAQ